MLLKNLRPADEYDRFASQALQLVLLGFFGVFAYNVFFFYGLHYISSSRASLIVALNPALIALTAFAFGRERLSRINVAGIALWERACSRWYHRGSSEQPRRLHREQTCSHPGVVMP